MGKTMGKSTNGGVVIKKTMGKSRKLPGKVKVLVGRTMGKSRKILGTSHETWRSFKWKKPWENQWEIPEVIAKLTHSSLGEFYSFLGGLTIE